MLVLGGATRTGKGIISQELMKQLGLPVMSIDPLKMALVNSVKCYPLDTNGSSIQVSEEMWPFISALIKNCDETGVDYIFEGEILPKHIQELRDQGLIVPSCFIGYKDIRVQSKVHSVKNNAGHPNDWTVELSDRELSELIEQGIEYSQYLYEECQKLNLKYVDFSTDFESAKLETIQYLIQSFQDTAR